MHDSSDQPVESEALGLNDRDLLRRFIRDSDEAAFAEVVRRYHGLVMSVCRRVTGRAADAEDAFQATFLCLARRPGSISKAGSLSSWLYTVARRTSWRLVKQRRKQPMETLPLEPAQEPPGPLEQIAATQNLLLLDEELEQLPSKYRDVLVITYFAEQSNQQIADQLNVSRGTIDGRLRRGRNLLRVRLARRGVSLGVMAVASGLLSEAAAATSTQLMASTTELGIQTLSNTVPGTTDLSQLEILVRPETAVISSKLVMTGVVCVSVVAGALGLQGLGAVVSDDDASTTVVLDGAIETGEGGESEIASAIFVSQTNATEAFASDAQPVEVQVAIAGAGAGTGGGGRFEPWAADAQPIEKWMCEMLDKPVPPLDYRGETPLSEILDHLAEHYTQNAESFDLSGTKRFRMTIWPDEVVLAEEQIVSLDDVTVSNIELDGVRLRTTLKLIFEKTYDPPLTYVIQDDVMKITTVDAANSTNMLMTRVYSVGHLMAVKTPVGQGINDVGRVIIDMTSPPLEWVVEGGDGSISLFGDSLVIRQTRAGHQEIVRLLNLLSESTD
jgi:RNA polymerase sigma factor (sigma-70 family)